MPAAPAGQKALIQQPVVGNTFSADKIKDKQEETMVRRRQRGKTQSSGRHSWRRWVDRQSLLLRQHLSLRPLRFQLIGGPIRGTERWNSFWWGFHRQLHKQAETKLQVSSCVGESPLLQICCLEAQIWAPANPWQIPIMRCCLTAQSLPVSCRQKRLLASLYS